MQTDVAILPVDFLTIGHVCLDVVPGGFVIGGAAAYTASVAKVMGFRVGIVTSAAEVDGWGDDLAGIAIHTVNSAATTVFENVYTPSGRIQTIHAVAGDLTVSHIPSIWTRTPVVFIGPIANEVDSALIEYFSNSLVGVGPQGWMRRWDERGHVYKVGWESAEVTLPKAAVTFLSREDLPNSQLIENYSRLAKILVITDGPKGCDVFTQGETRHFPAPAVTAVDSTGAGDIFATAYLLRLYQTNGDFWAAAEFANQVAARSVTCRGLPDKMIAIRDFVDEHFNRTGDPVHQA